MKKRLQPLLNVFVLILLVAAILSIAQDNQIFGYKMFGLSRALWVTDLVVLGKLSAVIVGFFEMPLVGILGLPALVVTKLELTPGKSELLTSCYLVLLGLCGYFYEDSNSKSGSQAVPDMINLYSALGLKPLFPVKRFPIHKGKCFYVGPFEAPFGEIYVGHIKPALERVGYTVFRADDIFRIGMIMEDIWESINTCELLVADITGKNPNAFYEIGMAHAIGKKVILITQSIDDVPFDLRHYRIVSYSNTPAGCANLEQTLSLTARSEAEALPRNAEE